MLIWGESQSVLRTTSKELLSLEIADGGTLGDVANLLDLIHGLSAMKMRILRIKGCR